jgi:hypothetical protein
VRDRQPPDLDELETERLDDGFGKRLAAQEGVEVFTTQDLAVELASRGVLGSLHAYGIYRIVYKNGTREEFDRLVDAARP